VPEAEHGEAAGFDASQNNRLIKALNKAHHLKLQIALICPEPWNGSIEMRRFSSETRRNGARLIRRVLHGLQSNCSACFPARELRAVSNGRDGRIGSHKMCIDPDAILDIKASLSGELNIG
jgi:hypothetical protein